MIQFLFVFNDIGILVLRVVLGLILVSHSFLKFRNLKASGEKIKKVGLGHGNLWAIITGLIQGICGLGLLTGFLTQIFALIVVLQFLIVLVIKVINIKRCVECKCIEFVFLILATGIILATTGSGAYGLDEILRLILY